MSKNIDNLRRYTYVYRELVKISKSLSNLDVQSCNYGLTPIQEKRELRLIKKAQELAKEVGLKAYHQGDPRMPTDYTSWSIRELIERIEELEAQHE